MSDKSLAVLDALTPDDVLRQIQMVQQLMAKAMKVGEHYGVIPGTKGKPTLLKAGAEKLGLLFRLAPTYQVETIDLDSGHREVRVICRLTQITTQRIFGEGIGSCSTMESKYRYRNEVVEGEDGKAMLVPGEYWKDRDAQLLGGQQFSPKKMDGKWVITHKVEHSDPADYYNTIAKMAAKRAYVAATISATAASDIFTQDLEDLGEIAPSPEKSAAPASETIRGKVSDVYEREIVGKDGNPAGMLSGGKIGGIGVWTKEVGLGQELLDANGVEVQAQVSKTAKSYLLMKLARIAMEESEPDELPY